MQTTDNFQEQIINCLNKLIDKTTVIESPFDILPYYKKTQNPIISWGHQFSNVHVHV